MKEIKLTKQMLRGGMQDRNRRREICKFNDEVKEYNKPAKKIIQEAKDGLQMKSMSSVKSISSFDKIDSDFEKVKPKLRTTRSCFGWFDNE
jgi:hypothetical protein